MSIIDAINSVCKCVRCGSPMSRPCECFKPLKISRSDMLRILGEWPWRECPEFRKWNGIEHFIAKDGIAQGFRRGKPYGPVFIIFPGPEDIQEKLKQEFLPKGNDNGKAK